MKKKLIIVLGILAIILLGNVYTYSTTSHDTQVNIKVKETNKDQVIFEYDLYNCRSMVFTIDFYKDNENLGSEYVDVGLSFGNVFHYRKLNPFTIANEFFGYIHDYGVIELENSPEENPHFLSINSCSDRKQYSDSNGAQLALDGFQYYEGFKDVDPTDFRYVEGSCKGNILAEMEYKNLKYTLRYFTSNEERLEYKKDVEAQK